MTFHGIIDSGYKGEILPLLSGEYKVPESKTKELLELAKDNNKTLHEIDDSIKEYLETMQQIVKEMK